MYVVGGGRTGVQPNGQLRRNKQECVCVCVFVNMCLRKVNSENDAQSKQNAGAKL